MDPQANLNEQEEILPRLEVLVREYYASGRKRVTPEYADLRERISDLRQALYDWLAGGGFEPDWTKAPTAAEYYGK